MESLRSDKTCWYWWKMHRPSAMRKYYHAKPFRVGEAAAVVDDRSPASSPVAVSCSLRQQKKKKNSDRNHLGMIVDVNAICIEAMYSDASYCHRRDGSCTRHLLQPGSFLVLPYFPLDTLRHLAAPQRSLWVAPHRRLWWCLSEYVQNSVRFRPAP